MPNHIKQGDIPATYIRMPPELKEWYREQAEREQRPMSFLFVKALEAYRKARTPRKKGE